VGVEPHRALVSHLAHLLERVDVALAMRFGDPRLHIVAIGSFRTGQCVECLVRESFVHGAHAVGPLGMAWAGIVADERGVRDEKGRHRPADLRVRVGVRWLFSRMAARIAIVTRK